MANQFFEVGGLRIDLSKVASHSYCSSGGQPCGSVDVGLIGFGFGHISLPPPIGKQFLEAMEAYRESLKPKYQFKDGWYICQVVPDGNPYLRYIRNDIGYDADGTKRMRYVKDYATVVELDVSPPPPSKFED